MTLKQYYAFVYAVEEGTISKASEKLGATQSGLTHLILSLEEELGFTLMKRNKGGIKLTTEGKRLFPLLKDLCGQDEKIKEVVRKIKGESSNKINVGTFTSVAVNWLPAIVNGFKKEYPDVEICITDGGYGEILKGLETGSIDVGFIRLPVDTDAKIYPLYKDRMLAVLPKEHPLATLKALPVTAFENEAVVSLAESTDFDSRSVFEKANVKPNIKYRTTDDYAMISMVENNLGICLMPELLLSGRTQNVAVMETIPPSFRTIALAVPYEKQANLNVLKLAEYIISWVSKNTENGNN